MKIGKMHKFGEVILAKVQYTDASTVKTRPAVILFEEEGNVVVAGITSNVRRNGIPLSKNDGAIKNSVIRLNYIFTISRLMIKRYLFRLSEEKKSLILKELTARMK
jgi:mRNA interferase MazF